MTNDDLILMLEVLSKISISPVAITHPDVESQLGYIMRLVQLRKTIEKELVDANTSDSVS